MRRSLALLSLLLLPAAAAAQTPVTPTADTGPRASADSLYLRAQRMVMNGAGTDGRAIVDSLLRAARPGSAAHAEALYWRAALAETAAEAERDYLRLTIEYPLSARTADALYRLGQLELTRGNRTLALSRFERLAADFPDNPQRGRALLGMGRIYLDQRRLPQGCAAVAEAQRVARAQDVELRNQVTFLSRQCVGVNTTNARAADGAAAAPAAAAAADPAAAPTAPASAAPVEEPVPAPAEDSAKESTKEAAGEAVKTPPKASTGAPAKAPVKAPARSAPSAAAPARAAAPTAAPRPTPAPRPVAPAARPAPRPSSRPGFAVQVAAFDELAPARALAAKLRDQGFDARVEADGPWQKVRVGFHATRAEASALAKRLKAKGVEGFVTGVGGR